MYFEQRINVENQEFAMCLFRFWDKEGGVCVENFFSTPSLHLFLDSLFVDNKLVASFSVENVERKQDNYFNAPVAFRYFT